MEGSLLNGELETLQKGMILAYFTILIKSSLGGTEENLKLA
jgi:hypothetical protein